MAQIVYEIVTGVPDFTAHIEPNVAVDQVLNSYGIYLFDELPEDIYTLTVTDSNGCISINVIDLTTPTTTTTSTTDVPTTTTTTTEEMATQERSILFNTANSPTKIYAFNPVTKTSTLRTVSGLSASSNDIAHTQNKMWLYYSATQIDEWNISVYPFVSSYNRRISNIKSSAGLCAKDNTTLICVSGTGVYESNVSTSIATNILKFNMLAGRTVAGDFMLTTTNKFIVSNTANAGTLRYITQYDYTTGVKELDIDITATIARPQGLFEYNGEVYITSYISLINSRIYKMSMIYPYALTLFHTASYGIYGASMSPPYITQNISTTSTSTSTSTTSTTSTTAIPTTTTTTTIVPTTTTTTTNPLITTTSTSTGIPTTTTSTSSTTTTTTTSIPFLKAYYFANSGNNSNTGLSPSSPFATISKANSLVLNPGDALLFKCGDAFTGTLTVSKSGTLANPIVISSYGSGTSPVITGFQTISGWTNVGGGIYSKIVSVASALTMLLIDDVQYAMGRYPNSGWLYYDSHVGTTSITDAALPSSPNFTGGDAIIRKSPFTTNKNPITNHTAQTLTITNTETLTNGYGYFIQNNLNTLDAYGEWFYNTSTSTLYVYFGAVDPTTKTTQIPSSNYGISIADETHYITFSNLKVKGYVLRGISLYHNDYITVNTCDVSYCGNSGIRSYVCDNVSILNTSIDHCNDWGIFGGGGVNNLLIQGCSISNTETFIGQGQQTNMSGVGIYAFQGTNIIVENNTVTNSGEDGIIFGGNNQIVRNNYVDTFCLYSNDAGGIYYGEQTAYTNMTITGNIVLNGFGNSLGLPVGTPNGAANGIYIDYNTTGGVTISDNTVANNNGHGMFIHASSDCEITGNTSYNNIEQLYFQETPGLIPDSPINNIILNNNIFVAKELTQLAFWGRLDAGRSWTTVGTLNNNYYARPISDATPIKAMVNLWDAAPISLSAWKTLTGQEAASLSSPFAISSTNDILFDYNTTLVNKTVTSLVDYYDLDGIAVTEYTLLPFTSIILLLNP